MSLREDFEVERMNDRDLYHGGPDGSQRPEAGPIGIEGPGGLTFCVGCLWCQGDFDTWAASNWRSIA